MSARSLDKARKDFSKILGELGLQITAQSNLKIVNYLDVTLNLTTAKYYPYRKPDNNPLYINAKSNHPPSIIKHLPASISTRISSLSCDPDEFNKASQTYNDALKTSGYHENLRYVNIENRNNNRSKNRPRNIIWFNPPYSENVQTNVARSFLSLIDKHFPKAHILHKLFNRNNVKVSYSCTSNMSFAGLGTEAAARHNLLRVGLPIAAAPVQVPTVPLNALVVLTKRRLSIANVVRRLLLPCPRPPRKPGVNGCAFLTFSHRSTS